MFVSLNEFILLCYTNSTIQIWFTSAVFRSSNALFDENDTLISRVRAATKICHAWDESSEYFDVACLTGIPSHIITYVNQEKLSKQIDIKFNEYATTLVSELDKRQMGGNMMMELIKNSITDPLKGEMEAIRRMVRVIASGDNANNTNRQRTNATVFRWISDSTYEPRLLPEYFQLNTAITPLSIWQQWHHGLTLPDKSIIGPLKDIKASHCKCPPGQKRQHHNRTYLRMTRFCKALDAASETVSCFTRADLARIFDTNMETFREKGILLPSTTPVGRKRKRNENGWDYIARQYDAHIARQKRAEKSELTVDELLQQDQLRERERQRKNRVQRKQKKAEAAMGEDDLGEGSLEQSARTSTTTGVTRRHASQMTNLFS